MDKDYYKKQIITYMGNKRKVLRDIQDIIDILNLDKSIAIGEGFSGSGIVSRLLKDNCSKLYVNDMAGYSKTLNDCYLANPTPLMKKNIKQYIEKANKFADNPTNDVPKYIQKYWSPQSKNIKKGERVYFTYENGKRIDAYRYFIEKLPEKYKPFLLGPLLVQCSIHTNTSGHFAAFYKENDVGKYGGKTGTDIKRITQKITLEMPLFSEKKAKVFSDRQDVNDWVKKIPKVDIMYYDPPYNKHPYAIFYFLLDIINDWDIKKEIPDTYRGQPKNWKLSSYNSKKHAEKVFEELIKNTKAKKILISYNNTGIIPPNKMENMLKKYGYLIKFPIEHKTYNKMKGIANYKRKEEKKKIKEMIYLLDLS
tara:strand:+ start:9035 stop:10132 length:1098 start_codon:yes stop_codon:yes gene_type:complete